MNYQHVLTHAKVKKQRDDLLRALKFALPYVEATKAKSGTQISSIAADIGIIRSAIARAEGRQA